MNPLKTPTMAKRDRIPLLNLNPRPSKQPKTQSESDMDLAFMLQTQEAMAASLAIKPSSGCMRLYCKGLVKEEMVRGRKVTLAGAGIAICDGRDNLIFQNWKSLKGCVGGRVLSREAAELQALVEGLNEAINLKFKNVIFFCDDRLLYHYVMNSQLPRTKMVATLVNQLTSLRKKFEYCNLHLVASGDIKFASKFATEAMASQITSPTKTSKAKIIKLPCKICFEDTYIAGMYSIDHCPHMYCLSCMKKHVEVKFQTGMVPQCPHKDCKSKLSINRCKIFLAPKLVDVMIERIKESSIPSTEKVYCPYPKCSALMSKKEVLEYTMTSFVSEGGRKCMKCHHYFCIHCKVPWHYNMTCNDYKRSQTYFHTGDYLIKSLATKKLWRQCSKCRHMVELTSGCYHITCRCGFQFCYTCGAEWKNKKATCSCPLWAEHNIFRPVRA